MLMDTGIACPPVGLICPFSVFCSAVASVMPAGQCSVRLPLFACVNIEGNSTKSSVMSVPIQLPNDWKMLPSVIKPACFGFSSGSPPSMPALIARFMPANCCVSDRSESCTPSSVIVCMPMGVAYGATGMSNRTLSAAGSKVPPGYDVHRLTSTPEGDCSAMS